MWNVVAIVIETSLHVFDCTFDYSFYDLVAMDYNHQVLQYKRKCTELEADAEAETYKLSASPSPVLGRDSPARSYTEKPSVSNVSMATQSCCHGYQSP